MELYGGKQNCVTTERPELLNRLPTIHETEQSVDDKADVDKNLAAVQPFKIELSGTLSPENEEMEFDSENRDELLEQLNVIGIKMDIHKSGMLYLKEAVFVTVYKYRT